MEDLVEHNPQVSLPFSAHQVLRLQKTQDLIIFLARELEEGNQNFWPSLESMWFLPACPTF